MREVLTELRVRSLSTADLVSMNESFVRARTIFDSMMEESFARHSECNGPCSHLLSQLANVES